MPPGSYNLQLYQGDTHHWSFTLWLDSKKTEAADLTGATAKSEIKDKAGGTLLANMTCAVVQPNTVNITFPAALWSGWPSNKNQGVWDLQITYASGDVQTIVAGSVAATQDVTT